jgi:hypothetical protein
MGGLTTELEILPWDKHALKSELEQFTKMHDKSFMFDIKKKAYVDL